MRFAIRRNLTGLPTRVGSGRRPGRAASLRRVAAAGAALVLLSSTTFAVQAATPGATTVATDDTPIAATSSGCATADLANTGVVGLAARISPSWATIADPNHLFPNDPPTILEGSVATPQQKFGTTNGVANGPGGNGQSSSEVAEEDLPWNHYTHDKTIDVIPDRGYQHLLSSYLDQQDPSQVQVHDHMEVEWESASSMQEPDGSSGLTWGGEPQFVWPSVGDRVWVSGRWVFDCGHTGLDGSSRYIDPAHVNYSTEIHPPRAVAVFRDLAFGPVTDPPNTVAGSLGSWLGVTGSQTSVPVTRADMFVSGNGGGDNNICAVNAILGEVGGCVATGPFAPVNDRNYVFDIYPPGTDFKPADQLPNKTWPVTPPTADSSLQWRTLDQFSPAHACGTQDLSSCTSITPIFCPIDARTGVPDQTETTCPPPLDPPATPTRLRVILPFLGAPAASAYAQSLFLGWDDVPGPAGPTRPLIRTFQIRLHEFRILTNGDFTGGDWRVFVGVGGEWKYMSGLTSEEFPGCTHSITIGGIRIPHPLTDNSNGDCFGFDNQPWTVSVQDGTEIAHELGAPIHIAVGGFESDLIDNDFCKDYQGCTFSVGQAVDLETVNDDRIGTVEYDLRSQFNSDQQPNYGNYGVTGNSLVDFSEPTKDGESYEVAFTVTEAPTPAPPSSAPLSVGSPQFSAVLPGACSSSSFLSPAASPTSHFSAVPQAACYVTTATPLTLSTQSTDLVGFQYRSYQDETLPTYPSALPFPVHWTATDFKAGLRAIPISLAGSDGPYTLQYSAQTADAQGNPLLTEPRHTAHLVLDNTPPTITFATPAANAVYVVGSALTVGYSCNDGGSGVASCVGILANGTALPTNTVGSYSFTVTARDNLGNTTTQTVTYSVTYRICLLYDSTKAAGNAGSTVPIRFQLCDANGKSLSSASIAVTAVSLDGNPPPPNFSGSTNLGHLFRYDSTIKGYVYNLNSKGLTPGTHTIGFTASGDPITHTAAFILK